MPRGNPGESWDCQDLLGWTASPRATVAWWLAAVKSGAAGAICCLRKDAKRTILVSMTSFDNTPLRGTRKVARKPPQNGHWLLQDAKARLSELVRLVRSEGPQHVTVHGRDAVVVISAETFARLNGEQTGAGLVAAMQASPLREVDLAPAGVPLPVRDVIF